MCSEVGINPQSLCYGFLKEINSKDAKSSQYLISNCERQGNEGGGCVGKSLLHNSFNFGMSLRKSLSRDAKNIGVADQQYSMYFTFSKSSCCRDLR